MKKYCPFVIDWGRSVKKFGKRIQLEEKKRKNDVISFDSLKSDLLKLGIQKGDQVIVHSSLSKMGYVAEGAKTLVDALLDIIGEEGTLLCPCFAHHTFSKYYLDQDPVFDVKNSPSRAGAVTEYIRNLSGAKRSLHPTDSVCAIGAMADYFTNTHFDQLTPYNENSPYYKLALQNGKILNIGVPLNTSCTNLHTLEDAVDFRYPVYHTKIYTAKLINEKGELCTMKTKVHDPVFSQKRKPDDLVPLFEKEGIYRRGTVGEA
ncbi:MAG TPA: AAC(3) family N-acetyltransferase, partial [Bacteroidia bacterium]|nr:AAC(3) family N-acetyltransferase [Bacteroidia bacterium]